MSTNAEATDAMDQIRRLAEDQPNRPVAVVTGASGGIGSQTASFLAEDHIVLAIGRNRERLEAVAEQAPGSVIPLVLDLNDVEGIEKALKGLPRVNALVNAAAIAPRATLEDSRPDDWQSMFLTNVTAPAELTRVLLPLLRESRGTVVFLGSGASRACNPYNMIYAATKHALQATADSIRQQVAEQGVRIATVAPGPTDTAMVQWEDDYPQSAPERLIEPSTVARSIRHVIDAPADTQLTEVWVRPRVEAK